MRGTGLGHVARLAGELVGPTGAVIGLDQSAEALTIARERILATGATHVTFMQGNASSWTAPARFDVVVEYLLLFHVADPVAVVHHHMGNLRHGGIDAGLAHTTTFGVQGSLSARDPSGPRLLSGVVRSLAPAIVSHGIATDEQLELATFEQRLRDAVRLANAVVLPPTVRHREAPP